MAPVIAAWHALVRDNAPDRIEALLADDVEFYSPVSHRPHLGRDMAAVYLRTALSVLNKPGFHYTGEWIAPGSAVLEFEGPAEGLIVNGVDMIWWNDQDRITRFKVMLRPLKAINLVHQHMGARLIEAFGR